MKTEIIQLTPSSHQRIVAGEKFSQFHPTESIQTSIKSSPFQVCAISSFVGLIIHFIPSSTAFRVVRRSFFHSSLKVSVRGEEEVSLSSFSATVTTRLHCHHLRGFSLCVQNREIVDVRNAIGCVIDGKEDNGKYFFKYVTYFWINIYYIFSEYRVTFAVFVHLFQLRIVSMFDCEFFTQKSISAMKLFTYIADLYHAYLTFISTNSRRTRRKN